jgi:hypothetical protein
MMRRPGFAETPPTGGKPLIVLIEYRGLTALRSLVFGQEANVLPSLKSPARGFQPATSYRCTLQ